MFSHIAPKLAPLFPNSVRSRGLDYFRQGRVKLLTGSDQSTSAVVRGSDRYEVDLAWEAGELSVYCTCPYLYSDGLCKHIWAAVLAAENHGYLKGIGTVKEVSIFDGDDDEDEGDLDFDEEEDEQEDSAQLTFDALRRRPPALPPPPRQPTWKTRLAAIAPAPPQTRGWPPAREILYLVDLTASITAGHPVLCLRARDRKANGGYSKLSPLRLQRADIALPPLAADREILSAIAGANEYYSYSGYTRYGQIPDSNLLRDPLSRVVMPLAARTGRCFLAKNAGPSEDLQPLEWDDRGPWRFGLRLSVVPHDPKPPSVVLAGELSRGEDEHIDLTAPALITADGLFYHQRRISTIDDTSSIDWLLYLRRTGPIEAPEQDSGDLLATLLASPNLPPVAVPEHLRYEEVTAIPRPGLRVRPGDSRHGNLKLHAHLFFEYEGREIFVSDKSTGTYDPVARRFLRRDTAAEEAALSFFTQAGGRLRPADYQSPEPFWELLPSKLSSAVTLLLQAGWHVEIDGKAFRRPGAFRLSVSSGLDWFELHGEVEYGDTSARIPELIEALRRGEKIVRLSDGSYGVLPEEWVRRIGMLAGMGTPEDGHIRFRPSQAGLLDALLAAEPEATFDAGFTRVREQMQSFRSVAPAEQPEGFVGHLRDYQREGLGWMDFLRRFSFGGCLADDMGVGKTAQVLALLESRRELRAKGETKPSLVVVPRSLIYNWRKEAERFTPLLRVLDYSGLKRESLDFSGYDLILVTYGTLRRDAARLKDVEFDYLVLDEAQAVKNSSTESAKAVRLLKGSHRLALSGTPVENHIGELWSLFEFLNPGMLGAAGIFKLSAAAATDEEGRKLLGKALRPFILRRTKDQVAKELPARTEQTIYCELEPPQRKLYDELRRHYRDSLLSRIETQGLGKSKIMVLEALLRLRQAACHPGLIDVKRSGEPSAKLEALREQLREVLDSGHKALVFSQFTSLLKIVRDRLDADGVVYEYLDGRTKDRQERVERFQNDPECKLFLISLKAGGLGLNLTAADYVFLLDPWWNPAVEAQAVDRAHRIGQTRKVFAYRLIAKDTVEEKVLELQKTKRDLAAAVIGEDNALIRDLRREDLELLLS